MNRARIALIVPCALAAALLAGCDDAGDAGDPLSEIDPAIARALNDQLMSDPDLVSINEANAALTRSSEHNVPADVDNPEAIREAQDRAVELLGGTRSVPNLPEPEPLDAETGESPLVMLADVALQIDGTSACITQASYASAWAARIPAPFPIFPRGTLVEALGADKAGCRVRAIRFRSAVPGDDTARFYLGRAKKAGYTAVYAANESGWQVAGSKGSARFLVRSRASIMGGQEIDLITLGGLDQAKAS